MVDFRPILSLLVSLQGVGVFFSIFKNDTHGEFYKQHAQTLMFSPWMASQAFLVSVVAHDSC